MNFFIADMHIGHRNVLAFDGRPFSNVLEHDKEIKRRWNERVTEDDDVYIIGNVSWLSMKNTVRYFSELNGRKHLIKSGHDQVILREKAVRDCFVEIRDYKELVLDNGVGIILCGYPILFYNNMDHGWFHFYGGLNDSVQDNIVNHVKKQITDLQKYPVRMLNISAMKPWMELTPRTFEELKYHCYRKKRRITA